MLSNSRLDPSVPLAQRMRPAQLCDFIGQQHLLAPGKPLFQVIDQGRLHSMILWGTPGTGKTTLAELLAQSAGAVIERLSAVLAGVKEIRAVVERARYHHQQGQAVVLFVDEVHRFNKAQQDALLPHVEQGLVTFIGATTENPSFALNNALLSRARVYVLKSLESLDIVKILQRALRLLQCEMDAVLQDRLAVYADGDARAALNLLEVCFDLLGQGQQVIEESIVKSVLSQAVRRFDAAGDIFYDQISALHKSVRGSDPDAALYWLCRMLEAGCDANYLARRLVRIASEDIGNADPRGLAVAMDAWQVFERLGAPEGELALAQAVVYLACAPKSNAVYCAFNEVRADIKQQGSLAVPMHLRNAPTRLMKQCGYGQRYRYPHDEPHAFAAGVDYFPDQMQTKQYYHPVERGLEIKIKAKLDQLRQLNKKVRS